MATITGLTADRMAEIEGDSVVDGDIVGDNLILTKKDGTQIDAGNVRGPQGIQGLIGNDLAVLNAYQILDVGLANQIRAGRQLAPADFTNIGLSAPIGLWNLSDLTDASGSGHPLTNKGAVPFATGINGVAATAAQFVGSAAQALYIADTGAADPFRIRTGSWGCWFRTAKRGTFQGLVTKTSGVNGFKGYWVGVHSGNTIYANVSPDGTSDLAAIGVSDIADDRWHFAVATYDGAILCVYIDGILEAVTQLPQANSGGIAVNSAPVNIGSQVADAATAPGFPTFGRVDEAFITGDVLTEEQQRNLYCSRLLHALGQMPSRAVMSVHRRRRGAALVSGDFPAQPLRLHNFTGGALTDAGSNNVPLVNNNAATVLGGADGTPQGAFNFKVASNQSLSSTDAGLPAAFGAMSMGAWFKSNGVGASNGCVMGYGTVPNNERLLALGTDGFIRFWDGVNNSEGCPAADGQWHFVVVVIDNAAADGLKSKQYVDGRLCGSMTGLTSVTLGGANKFRVGANVDGTQPFTGLIDTAFVCGYALTYEQQAALYAKGAQDLGKSPKNSGDHVETMTATGLLAIFDTLESTALVDLAVA